MNLRAIFSRASNPADQESLNEQLRVAAKNGYHAKAEKLLEQGANADAPGAKKVEPLMLAALRGDELMCRLLLMHGANPDAGSPGEPAGTALTQAVREGFFDVVKTLVEFKANIDLKEYSRTPLHEALWKNRTEIARFLVENGASMEVHDRMGRTPMEEVISLGDKLLAGFMVDKGANLDFENDGGTSMKDLMRAEGWHDVVDAAAERDALKAQMLADAAAAVVQAEADFKGEMEAVHILKNPVRALKPVSFRQRA
ncbi:MAG: ankyrin repeat domain-containing protein [Micavibrio sp.]|nr:ankyrin repeat domain-containing protein [Micavibrio sp.]